MNEAFLSRVMIFARRTAHAVHCSLSAVRSPPMSLTRKIASNTVIQVGGKFLGTILGLFTVAVMTRSLGRSGYGAFTTVTSFLQFFGILVDFGLTLTMAKMIAEAPGDEDRVASNIFSLRFVSAVVFFGIAPLIAMLFPYSADVKTGITIAALSFFFMTLSQVLIGVFQRHLAAHLAATAEVAGRTALFLGVLTAAHAHAGLSTYIVALAAGNAFQFLLSFLFARRFVRIRFACERNLWKKIIATSWPIGVSIAFNLIYLKGDIIVLSITRTQAEVGLYGAAYKVLDVITVVPMIFMGFVLPVLSAAWIARRREDFTRKLWRAFDFMVLIAVPLAAGTFAVGTDLMRFVGGPAFAASGELLSILMLAGSAVFLSALFGHAVVALGLQRKMIAAYALDALASILLYFFFIPRVGAIGAAWVTVFSETFIMLACGIAVCAKIKTLPPARTFAAAIGASALMFAALHLTANLHVLPRIVIGIVIYTATILVTGVVTRTEIRSLLQRS